MVSSFYLLLPSSFFLAYSQPSQIGCLPYFHTWCGLSANLGCRSETCCTRLAENTGCKKSPKIRHLRTITHCRAVSSQLRHVSTIGKKLVKQQYLPTSPHNMVNFGPLAAEISSLVWGTPANFNGFHVLASLLQRHRSIEANQTLHYVWPSPGLIHYIHFPGLLPRNRILPGAKFTLHPSLALSCIGSINARHSSRGRQPNFAALSRERHLYLARRAITLGFLVIFKCDHQSN